MKQKWSYVVALAVVIAAFCGCSGIQRVINTGDSELMFDRAMVYYEAEKWTKAASLLEACEHYYKGTLKEDSVSFYLARCRFKEGDYATSSTLFDEFRRSFGRSEFMEDAEAMYAISMYNMCPTPERDQSTTSQAIIAITEFMSHYPDSAQYPLFQEMLDDLTWRLHEKAYINAYTYYKIERYNSAIIAFRNALKQYPDSHRREDVMYHIVMSSFKLADNSVAAKQMDRFMTTLDSYYSFIMEFPESKYRKDVDHAADVAKRYIEKNRKEE
ncbi:MAG: outer membrane protein assembly factor BamD [Ruminococcus flavefaciens]|nr:outer membrane protein assembly factor BamD [Ruminococcus flavefaciens]